MVEMYVWLVVAVIAAVGVLLLAGVLAPGDPDDVGEADGAPPSAWSSLWRDFLSATSNLRARVELFRHPAGRPAGSDTSPQRFTILERGRSALRAHPGGESPAVSSTAPAAAQPATTEHSWFHTDPAESNTTFDEFFEATATSEPAYLDAAQLSDALNSLRR